MNYKPYLKAGAIIAIPKIKYERNETYSSGNNYSSKEEYSGGFGLGASASLGTKIETTEKISFWEEAYFNHISWTPKKLKETDNKELQKRTISFLVFPITTKK